MPHDKRKKAVCWGGAGYLALFFLVCIIVVFFRGIIQSTANNVGIPLSLFPWQNLSIGVPILLSVIVLLVIIWWSNKPTLFRNFVIVLLFIVDLGSFGWFYEWKYYVPNMQQISSSNISENYTELRQTHQRILPLRGGLGLHEELPPNLSRLWGVPNSSGYNPLIMSQYSRFMNMSTNGSVRNFKAAADSNNTWDLLATKYVFFPLGVDKPQVDFLRYNFGWSNENEPINIGEGNEGNHRNTRIYAPDNIVNAFGIVTTLSASINIPQGTTVAEVSITNVKGDVEKHHLIAGTDTSEWAWDRKDVRTNVKHQKAKVFDSFVMTDGTGNEFNGHYYFTEIPLNDYQTIKNIEFKWVGPAGVLSIYKISLKNTDTNSSYPITMVSGALNNINRWQPVEKLSQTVVYENLRALPRAWLVPEVVSLTSEQILTTVEQGTLPNGEQFNPRKTALIESPIEFEASNIDNNSSVKIVRIGNNEVNLVTESQNPSFLILSDVNYPGWQAQVDGQQVPVFQTDYILRGIAVPAGGHVIKFEYKPLSFYIGASISGITFIILLLLVLKEFIGGLKREETVR